MNKKHIITIAGKPGSGKSTTSKKLASTLSYGHFSSGDFFRAIGKERGIDVLATNMAAENEREIDYLVDEKLRILGSEQDNLVIDSRMAWHWMPYSFRVYLNLDLKTAAERIIGGMDEARRAAEHIPNSIEEYALQLTSRLESEARRYQTLYNVNPYDINNYDLVVDTGQFSIPEVEQMILESYHYWLE
jgi:cytidylate kinase